MTLKVTMSDLGLVYYLFTQYKSIILVTIINFKLPLVLNNHAKILQPNIQIL